MSDDIAKRHEHLVERIDYYLPQYHGGGAEPYERVEWAGKERNKAAMIFARLGPALDAWMADPSQTNGDRLRRIWSNDKMHAADISPPYYSDRTTKDRMNHAVDNRASYPERRRRFPCRPPSASRGHTPGSGRKGPNEVPAAHVGVDVGCESEPAGQVGQGHGLRRLHDEDHGHHRAGQGASLDRVGRRQPVQELLREDGDAVTTKTTAVDLMRMLLARYQAPEWVVLDEVSNGTGFQSTNRADALAMSIWPSRGIALHGFEVKVSRADLLKELATPAKADAVGKFCEYWWLVVSDKKLVDGVAVPETWGVLAPSAGVLRQVKEAVKTKATPWTPAFVASMLRNQASGMVSGRLLEQERAERRKILDEELKKCDIGDMYKNACDKLSEKVRAFQEATGVSIEEWKYGDIRAAMFLVEKHGHTGVAARIARMRDIATQLANSIDKVAATLPGYESSEPAGVLS